MSYTSIFVNTTSTTSFEHFQQNRPKKINDHPGKNMITNFKGIFIQILKEKRPRLSKPIKDYIKSIKSLKALSIFLSGSQIENSPPNLSQVLEILKVSIEEGEFLRYICDSRMEANNKINCLQFLSSLYNGFKTGKIQKWMLSGPIPQMSSTKDKLQNKKEPEKEELESQSEFDVSQEGPIHTNLVQKGGYSGVRLVDQLYEYDFQTQFIEESWMFSSDCTKLKEGAIAEANQLPHSFQDFIKDPPTPLFLATF